MHRPSSSAGNGKSDPEWTDEDGDRSWIWNACRRGSFTRASPEEILKRYGSHRVVFPRFEGPSERKVASNRTRRRSQSNEG